MNLYFKVDLGKLHLTLKNVFQKKSVVGSIKFFSPITKDDLKLYKDD